LSRAKREILAFRLIKDEMMDCMDENSDLVRVTRRRMCHSLERIKEFRTVIRPRIVRFRVEWS